MTLYISKDENKNMSIFTIKYIKQSSTLCTYNLWKGIAKFSIDIKLFSIYTIILERNIKDEAHCLLKSTF